MTSPVRVDSVITTKIFEHYRMLQSDIDMLAQQLTRQLTVTYRQVIAQQLNLYGCQRIATGPDRTSLDWIEQKAAKDSEGIARTYDRELKNKIDRLRQSNPKGNRFFYLRALDAWIAQRNIFKVQSISLNTMTAAREYAKDRFITENGIEGKFVFTGPPPVCKDCVRIKGYGPMTYKQTRQPNRRLPAHPSCPHTYQALTLTKIDCSIVWTG